VRKNVSILIICLLSVFLISCATIRKLGLGREEQKEEWEYGRLVFIGDECVAWFAPDLNIIGLEDMGEYFGKNNIEPTETKVLDHFASLGWEVVGKTQKDKYTTEYQLKREKAKSANFIYIDK
jgi:hypothetical protein